MITAGRRRSVARITGILAGAAVASVVVAAPTLAASSQVGASDRPADFVVESPRDGQILDDPRPTFRGTTAFGNAIDLYVDGEEYASGYAQQGTWTLTPERDLPVGVRFNVTIRQYPFTDSIVRYTVEDVAVRYPRIAIETPADGSTVTRDVVFEGTSFPDAMISVRLDGEGIDGPLVAGIGTAEPAGDEEWPGRFSITEDGRWTFTPKAGVPPGDYTVTAEASLVGGDPELSDSTATSSFTVPGGAELPDTGPPGPGLLVAGAGLLMLGGIVVLAVRGRHV